MQKQLETLYNKKTEILRILTAEKQLKLIQQKYPKTTNNKEAKVVSIKINGKQLYESRFQFFTKKDANNACSRLKKYKRDCFIRG